MSKFFFFWFCKYFYKYFPIKITLLQLFLNCREIISTATERKHTITKKLKLKTQKNIWNRDDDEEKKKGHCDNHQLSLKCILFLFSIRKDKLLTNIFICLLFISSIFCYLVKITSYNFVCCLNMVTEVKNKMFISRTTSWMFMEFGQRGGERK